MKLCAYRGCGRRARARGLCSTHYARASRDGALPPKEKYTRERVPPLIRWAAFFVAGAPDMCWEWQGTLSYSGYGVFTTEGSTRTLAHRFAYELAKGPIEHGLLICHTCDNRRCVNPAHLWAGTVADNNADCRAKGRAVVPTPRSGELHSQCKLSAEQVARIREFPPGTTLTEIADMFGVSFQHVSRIRRRDRWKTLGENA